MSSQEKVTIAVCGAGIGGLTLAGFLSQSSNVKVNIYETKAEVSTIGSGIAIWKRSWEVLQKLGFEDDCKRLGIPTPKDGEVRGPSFRCSDSNEEGYDFYSHMMPYGPTSLARPTLLDILLSKLDPETCKVHTSKRLVKYTAGQLHTEKVSLTFSDGTTAQADVLIGADGVHSVIREEMFKNAPEFGNPKFSGQITYRSQISKDDVTKLYPDHKALTNPRVWSGKNKHVITHPFGPFISLACFINSEPPIPSLYPQPWSTTVPASELQAPYQDWEPDLVSLLKLSPDPLRWAVHIISPLPHYSIPSDRVALIGDAAHAMTPHQGVGAGQAIEDAYILGLLLNHACADGGHAAIMKALKVYSDIRKEPSQTAAKKSWKTGRMYDLLDDENGDKELGADKDGLRKLGERIGKEFAWLGVGGIEEEWKQAKKLYEEN